MRRLWLRAEAHAFAAGVRLALRLLPLPHVVAFLARIPRAPESISPAECARAAEEGARRAAHPTCLFTALTAFALLVRRGYAARLVIGAARDGGFDAHAWVTVEDAPLTDHDRDYVPLWTSGASPSGAS